MRINCISAGQIDIGIDLKGVCAASLVLTWTNLSLTQSVRHARHVVTAAAVQLEVKGGNLIPYSRLCWRH